MNIHEYQAKEVLRQHGVATAQGKHVTTVQQARQAAEELGGGVWAVKAQIHAGGRGKAGGVKLARSLSEVEEHAGDILGKTLVTPQTGASGQLVRHLYIESGEDIARELYLSLLVDTASEGPVFVVSGEGGMDIEQVAADSPDKILTLPVDPATGYQPWHGRVMSQFLGFGKEEAGNFSKLAANLYRAFVACDASLVEINPLVVTADKRLICLDAKMNFDDNALYRQPDILAMRDLDEEDPKEVEAAKHDLSYIRLDGNIGCMVNGAGLAMATMDAIQLKGGSPANFLDVGGGASSEKVSAAFLLILSDPNVRGILVNIFGGIMRCDVIAQGIIAAAKEVQLDRPLVVRLAGTNVDEGRALLSASGLPITTASDLGEAAATAVRLVSG